MINKPLQIIEEANTFLTFENGDILMTRIGSVGVTKLIDWDINASIYVSLALLKFKNREFSKYFYAYSKTPIYEAKALLEIGEYKKNPVDDAVALEKKLSTIFIDMEKNLKDKTSQISNISVVKGLKNFLEIKSESTSNEEAKNEILKVLTFVQNEHEKILDDVKKQKEMELRNIDLQISDIKSKSVDLIDKKIENNIKNLKSLEEQLKQIDENLKKIEIEELTFKEIIRSLYEGQFTQGKITEIDYEDGESFSLYDKNQKRKDIENSTLLKKPKKLDKLENHYMHSDQ